MHVLRAAAGYLGQNLARGGIEGWDLSEFAVFPNAVDQKLLISLVQEGLHSRRVRLGVEQNGHAGHSRMDGLQ